MPTAAPFHVVPLAIVPVQVSVLVDQLTAEGSCAWTSHVPAAMLFDVNVIVAIDPDCSVTTPVPELLLTVTVPEL